MNGLALRDEFAKVLDAGHDRMIVLSQIPFMSAAVNDNGKAAFFIRASLAPHQSIKDGQGFTVKTERSGENDYIRITATESGISGLFLKLAEYVLEQVTSAGTPEAGVLALVQAVDDYRRFIGRRRGRLTDSMVRGTFAELRFLEAIISGGMNSTEAVSAWRGPWAKLGLGLHDFTFPDGRGIEIKSTHQPPIAIRVSSAGQLVPSKGKLDLVVLPIEASVSTEAVFFRPYARMLGKLIGDGGTQARDLWEAALQALSLDLSDEWYDQYSFEVGAWSSFRVADNFPHLKLDSVPAGIVDVRYSLELARITAYERSFESLIEEVVDL
ncbi:PD-(D/E)XK motif protein [Rathayibacter sp. AY1C4]|uniref:PD-(D/E)XK motif protein n=1 Tax=Rathayibacter sp. AY1C4 TaxID=2080537 RepID=UPI000CE92384|nr:PD-(D/E)XK motif protein [Rathayibacter sp. AY1C4]PPH21993.1 PD-(D/E)XK motif protein [Rathayibacter sp. AY1C4]